MNYEEENQCTNGDEKEYGLLKPIIAKLNAAEEFDVRIVVTGAHLRLNLA